MPDTDPVGGRAVGLQFARQQTRGRRSDDDAWIRGPTHLGKQSPFDLHTLGRALLNEIGTIDGLGDLIGDGDAPRRHRRRQGQPGVGAPRVLQHFVDALGGTRVGIIGGDVDAVYGEPRRPARSDNAGTDQGDAFDLAYGGADSCQPCRFSDSFSRTSLGPSMRTFIASRMVTARSTSWALEAKTPRFR